MPIFPHRLLGTDGDIGPLFGWGSTAFDQIGLGTSQPSYLNPTRVGTSRRWTQVSCGKKWWSHALIDRELWGTGMNLYLGVGTESGRTSAMSRIGGFADWEAVSCGYGHSLGLRNGGQLYAWGDSLYGETGQTSSAVKTLVPTRVGILDGWEFISAGYYRSYAIREGKLFVFGDDYGHAPVQIGSYTDWIYIHAGIAIIDNSRVGIRAGGFLYRGNSQVGEEGGWSHASCSEDLYAAIKDGMLYTWGSNSSYGTGLGVQSGTTAAPTLASDLGGWTKVAIGEEFGMAIRNGRLYAWGSNSSGQTGLGTTFSTTPVPTLVQPYGRWIDVSVRKSSGMGVRA